MDAPGAAMDATAIDSTADFLVLDILLFENEDFYFCPLGIKIQLYLPNFHLISIQLSSFHHRIHTVEPEL